MSGHSKWATIKRAKGKTDAARGKIFNRLIREITIAARAGGGDREGNPRLRAAIGNAKAQNMPSKNIDNAIAKGTGSLEGVNYEELVLEGFGPAGIAFLVEAMTDNRNRTVGEVRHAFTKAGGNLGAANSVSRLFKTRGQIRVALESAKEDQLMEIALEAGAEDMSTDDEGYDIITPVDSFEAVRSALVKLGIEPTSAELTKIAETTMPVTGDAVAKVLKLEDALDDLDDVQHVYGNFEISDEDLANLG